MHIYKFNAIDSYSVVENSRFAFCSHCVMQTSKAIFLKTPIKVNCIIATMLW